MFVVYFNKAQWQSFEASGFHLKPNYLPCVQLYVVHPLMINVGSVNHLLFFFVLDELAVQKGECIYSPIPIIPSEVPSQLRLTHFPLRLAFAISINNPQ